MPPNHLRIDHAGIVDRRLVPDLGPVHVRHAGDLMPGGFIERFRVALVGPIEIFRQLEVALRQRERHAEIHPEPGGLIEIRTLKIRRRPKLLGWDGVPGPPFIHGSVDRLALIGHREPELHGRRDGFHRRLVKDLRGADPGRRDTVLRRAQHRFQDVRMVLAQQLVQQFPMGRDDRGPIRRRLCGLTRNLCGRRLRLEFPLRRELEIGLFEEDLRQLHFHVLEVRVHVDPVGPVAVRQDRIRGLPDVTVQVVLPVLPVGLREPLRPLQLRSPKCRPCGINGFIHGRPLSQTSGMTYAVSLRMLKLSRNVIDGAVVTRRGDKYILCGRRDLPVGVYQAGRETRLLTDTGVIQVSSPAGIAVYGYAPVNTKT